MPPGQDSAYWERRRKNNEAAKRSRDSRRVKEEEVAARAQQLEQENVRLRCEVRMGEVDKRGRGLLGRCDRKLRTLLSPPPLLHNQKP